MRKIIALGLGAVLACLSLSVRADVPEPDVLIRDTVQDVLGILKKDKEIQASQKKVLELVDAKVLPHFDFERMTRLAVGKSWRSATPEQKKTLVAEFRDLLVRTYTKAFMVYRDQVVEVKPLRKAADATEATVKTVILKSGTAPIPVDYDMEKTPDGWKVYDLSIEGVSLVTNYRSTFSDQVQQSGIDGLIKMLVDKNKAAANTSLNKADAK